MADDGEPASVELASIKRDFPGWRPWRSDSGRWYAARTGDVTPPEEPSDWWAMTVFSMTADGLRAALHSQEDGMEPEEGMEPARPTTRKARTAYPGSMDGRRQAVANGRATCPALQPWDVSWPREAP